MRISLAVLAALALAGCDQPAESEGDSAPSAEPTAEATESAKDAPTLAESGWLVVGEDGAVYTTMLDADGTYRDFRNGDPLHSGEWEKRDKGEVCFTPAEEGLAGDCWTLGELEKDGTVRATDSDDAAIILRKISYEGPDEEETAGEEE